MTDAVGEKALNGEWERISNKCFEIQEDMVMTFEGRSCNLADAEGNPIPNGNLGPTDGLTKREVKAGYRCYVMRASVKFEKKNQTLLQAQTVCDRYASSFVLLDPQFARLDSRSELFGQFLDHLTSHK
ncbi:hypothetical protein BDV28DRAFT_126083 [Aspergillus coremiiformis]|uniref:Uncharacterized protein n=1 Tax=Aspergillus coremiiformis TaxID=138285 RepID=A0A5N6ZJ79_9EURO|nr:hypothetical protein BDV28DRAFT_126083 [Aspergillus coremiiformis]